MTIDLEALKPRLLADSAIRAEYAALEQEFNLAHELIAARARAGLSQAEVAARMGTTQSTIARLESGRILPSLRTLDRYATATGSRAVVQLLPRPLLAGAGGKRATRLRVK
jgi:transcriptional regulator with XRE-family HTH domain